MGHSIYSANTRTTSDRHAFYNNPATTVNAIFPQNEKGEIHPSMSPLGIIKRECRDSETHPASFPIILALDETGSMGHIPVDLIKTGLPKIMGKLTEHGYPDASLLFLAIGDTECDNYPLQVGQFESGDVELDTWLTRTYIEGNGGGNGGESYALAWYFAHQHTASDAWDKRKQKGFLFTVGDEPCLNNLPKNVINSLMGTTHQTGFSAADLLKAAQERYNVYHLHIMEGSAGIRSLSYWKELMGDHCIQVNIHSEVPKIITDIIMKGRPLSTEDVDVPTAPLPTPSIPTPPADEML